MDLKPSYYTLPEFAQAGYPGGCAFLLRHAERFPLASRQDVVSAGLTEAGRAQAFDTGRFIRDHYEIAHVASSPIQRCLDTAQLIVAGAGGKVAIQPRWWLFSPFLHVPDYGLNHPVTFETISNGKVVAQYPQARLQLVLERMKFPASAPQIHLYIAHDSTVLPIWAHLSGIRQVHAQDYPTYLQGVGLTSRNNTVELINLK